MTTPRIHLFRQSTVLICCRSLAALATLSIITMKMPVAIGEETTAAEPEQIAAGHSFHGEAFNEGPRQAALLMDGMAPIEFETSTRSERAQAFFEQGISQLHGFWYLEAERSFRQAAKEDPDMAMAYWGMAMANVNNDDRARGFIDQAKEILDGECSKREKLYIEALDRFLPKGQGDQDAEETEEKDEAEKERLKEAKKKRGTRYIRDMEEILHEFPNDIEAKAFLVVHMWMADRYGVKLTSKYAVSALLAEIFAANPNHPAHHYQIHLWDRERPENALESAAMCGPSTPAIAHMWHMPGHIYSRLHRYADAAWQQEASARVDHAHMIQTRLMPDQIHNFAHNNEWLVRNLIHLGRVNDAKDLARNLASLPKHPKYNSLKERGSHRYGRKRLIQVHAEFGLWDELIQETHGRYLVPVDDNPTRRDEAGWIAVAHFMTGNRAEGKRLHRELKKESLQLQLEIVELEESLAADADASSEEKEETRSSMDSLQEEVKELKPVLARVASAAAVARKDAEAVESHADRAKLNDALKAEWVAIAGNRERAIELAEKAVKDGESEVIPLAILTHLLWQDGSKEEAQSRFEDLRSVASESDLTTPLLSRLSPIAEAADSPADWRVPKEPAEDLGQRPQLDDLGPFRWQPYQASTWEMKTPDGTLVSSSELSARPRIVIFYLGFGCLHCVEQLEAFAPFYEKFRFEGIEIVGISTESVVDLQGGIKSFGKELSIPLYSDPDYAAFKQFRCWDDFENQPLHGTFLIDTQGRVRWQDIRYEPFTDPQFLLDESLRLLDLP